MSHKRLSRCGIENCKSTSFYLNDGQWFCKKGHLREGELEVEAEDEGFGPQGSRATKTKQEQQKVRKVLRGRKGFELFLQCYQLILQKQVRWLLNEKGFPPELEIIVRDLWALQLKKISTAVPGMADSAPSQEEDPDGEGSIAGGSSTTGWSSQSEYLYTSDEESQASTTRSNTSRIHRRRRRKVPKASDRPKLIGSVGLCYLGLVLLRVSISLGDLHRWIEEQGLVYLRAISEVPKEMKDRLDSTYWYALDPKARPKKGLLYHTVHDLVVMYQTSFGMTFPPLNTTLMTFRYIRDLGLPLEIYHAVKRLSDLMSPSFIWNGLSASGQKLICSWPEARLMSLVIIATKLLYGLDSVPRAPKSNAEPAAVGLRWEAWDKFLRLGNAERRGLLGDIGQGVDNRELEVDVKETDIFGMSGEDLDKYMDWFEKTWADRSNTKLSDPVLNLFPTGRAMESRNNPSPASEYSTVSDRLRDLHSQIELYSASHVGEKTERPGDQYLRHSSKTELPIQHQTLLQAAADLLTTTRDDLGKVLRHFEIQLKDQLKDQRKNEIRENKMDVDSE